jgi:hypothetical protein
MTRASAPVRFRQRDDGERQHGSGEEAENGTEEPRHVCLAAAERAASRWRERRSRDRTQYGAAK